jgi:hypothetical protein
MRRIALLSLVGLLLGASVAAADVGMRPPLLRFPQAQSLAEGIVLASADLNAKVRWRPHTDHPWMLDYNCNGAPNHRALILRGDASRALWAKDAGLFVTSTAHVFSSQEDARREFRGWSGRRVFGCFPPIDSGAGLTMRTLSRTELPLRGTNAIARAVGWERVVAIRRQGAPPVYWYADFVVVGDGRVNAFLQVMEVRRSHSSAETRAEAKDVLSVAATLIARIEKRVGGG